MKSSSSSCADRRGFTLIEVMLSMVILSVIMLVSVQVLDQTQRTWKRGIANIEQFREARQAFESITQNVRQALLNTYMAYQYNQSDTPTIPASKTEVPLGYMRQSELQFITGQATNLLGGGKTSALSGHAMFFQARLGLSDRDGYESLSKLLCGRGYFVLHGTDEAFRPAHVKDVRSRFRLWEYRPTAEVNTIYTPSGTKWYESAAAGVITEAETAGRPAHSRPIAENIVALIISPQVTQQDAVANQGKTWWIAPTYAYDSTVAANTSFNSSQGTQHMLPPRVMVTLIALDEGSARKLAEQNPEGVPKIIPDGAFTKCEDREKDMKAVETALQAKQLNYRVFSSTITMRNSKWNLLR